MNEGNQIRLWKVDAGNLSIAVRTENHLLWFVDDCWSNEDLSLDSDHCTFSLL